MRIEQALLGAASKTQDMYSAYSLLTGEEKTTDKPEYYANGVQKSEQVVRSEKAEDNARRGEDMDKAGKLSGSEKTTDAAAPEEIGDSSKTEEHMKNKHDGFEKDCPMCQCETCRNRRYKDGSDDSTVSFQNPTKMNPRAAASMVKKHEMEHVRHEQHFAKENDEIVIYQSVQIKTDICPECGDTYVSGGTTRTMKKPNNDEFLTLFRVGAEDMLKAGQDFNESA